MTDDDLTPQSEAIARRALLKAAAGGAAALAAVTAGSRLVLDEGSRETADRDPAGAITLASHHDAGVQALDLELGDTILPRVGPNQWRSQQLPTSTHSLAAFTWPAGSADPHIRIRSRVDGVWTNWRRVPRLLDGPNPDAGEGNGTIGTELLFIGEADGIEIHVVGPRPHGMTLVLLHPSRTTRPMRLRAGAAQRSGRTLRVPRPDIRSRADWGANEEWRDGEPVYDVTIRQVHVHHTVNGNTYSRSEVPGLIRSIYRYHTHNLGWSDIGYNFLVDRFGRVWTGRAGGVRRPVRGAHTLGFNAASTGVACIGNFEEAQPPRRMLDAVAALAAWKLDRHHRRPGGTVRVRSEGSDRYRAGQVAELPVIDGHRDSNDTVCPGRYLYAALPYIRSQASSLVDRYKKAEPTVTVRAEGRRNHLVVHVHVEPPAGVAVAATGQVVVGVDKRSKTRRLIDGAAVVQFGRYVPMRPGEHIVRVSYNGNRRLARARGGTRVTVV